MLCYGIVLLKVVFSFQFYYLLFHPDDLVAICKEYHAKVFKLEGDKWDLERGIKIRLLEVTYEPDFDFLIGVVLRPSMIKPPI